MVLQRTTTPVTTGRQAAPPCLTLATQAVSLDEPCIGLCEMNLASGLPGQGRRRYQIIYVVRSDRKAEFRRDLGPAASFKADQLRIPGAVIDDSTGRVTILHTVGQLVEIAERMREMKPHSAEFPVPDLWDRLRRQNEEMARLRRHASHFGPALSIRRG